MKKVFYFIILVAFFYVIYNFDAITGQWKFEKLCKEESGARYFNSLEKNVGWEVVANGELDYQAPFHFGYVKFVRWTDKNGNKFDVYVDHEIKKMPHPRKSEYILSHVDENNLVRYRYDYKSEQLADKRFYKDEIIVSDAADNKIMATYTQFGYKWTTPDRVILSAPTGVTCGAGETKESQQDIEMFFKNVF